MSDFDLRTALASLTSMLERLVGEDVRLEAPLRGEPAWVHGDRSMIEQVLLNLVVNARDAMEGRGARRLRIEVDGGFQASPPGGRAAGPFVILRVSDTGAGIPAAVLPHIFEPFFTTKEIGRGTGLGLSMVHGIVEQHGGWVSVESRVDEGSSFIVHLPRIPEATRAGAPDPTGAVDGGTETIVIVEDEPQVRRVAVRSLSKLGYRVLEASSAAEALDLMGSRPGEVALVMTDIIMPGAMTGFELAARLRETNPAVKIALHQRLCGGRGSRRRLAGGGHQLHREALQPCRAGSRPARSPR